MKNFVERWQGRGDEKRDSQKFWIEFLQTVCGIAHPTELIDFEKPVKLKHKSFIDVYIPSTRTIIEQKSLDVSLDKAAKMSDDSMLTPFEQAKRYSDWLPDSERARWIITCNFQEFRIYDMERPKADPEIVKLENLEKEWRKFLFMVNPKDRSISEAEISLKAGGLVEKLKNALVESYKNSDKAANNTPGDEILKKRRESITVFCVRIVFLLYAEDSGLFEKSQFHDYLEPRKIMARDALIKLFEVLNQKIHERDLYLDDDLKKFPYVNGGLFKNKNVLLPQIDDNIVKIILEDMSERFNWSGINPPIFGAIFERVLNASERESGGMHYTTVENIHKVIDPLFLDDLKLELKNIFALTDRDERTQKLIAFQNKLAALRFLDPACGSGNFLTESFKSLRKLENEIISGLKEAGLEAEIKVSISQFYGIEVNPFAVAVARTALWIANTQMLKAIEDKVKKSPLPLEEYDLIKDDTAMSTQERPDLGWKESGWKIPHDDMLYIMGNPPFLGYSQQNDGQKADVRNLLGSGKVDYVACWFAIASEYLQDKNTKAAFVATNSITQGEQTAMIFKPLHERWGIEIDFAHQSFVWNSELKDLMAHVHCVIIGFSTNPPKLRKLYTPEGLKLVENINFYLKPAPDFFIEARKTPICDDAPKMRGGNRPADGGHLIIDSQEEYEDFIKREPAAKKFIKQFMMANEFINNIPRYCLWLVDATPEEISKMPLVKERIKLCREDRLNGAPDRQKLADTPWLFRETFSFERYIAIPFISSEKRKYLPIGYLDNTVIPGDGGLQIIPDATLYHFGILTSRVHMAWMRATAGRLEMRYRYSNTVVYNNFPWPSVNEKQKAKIEMTAQKILDARALYPESSFASLYDETLMPVELRKAHRENDIAVCEAYGSEADCHFDKNTSEEEIVSALMNLYEKLSSAK